MMENTPPLFLFLVFFLCLLPHATPQSSTSSSNYKILSTLFHSTNGPVSWTSSSNWLQNTDPCSWYGITCSNDEIQSLLRIELADNGLSGSLPDSIWSIESLRSLHLGGNELLKATDLRDIRKAKNLEHLVMDGTGLLSVEGLVGVRDTLTSLHASNLDLGDDPAVAEELFDLVHLKQLFVSNSKLSGELSSEISRMVNLEELDLSRNHFHGTLPAEIGTLTKLTLLNLNENRFDGSLPLSLESLVNLDVLSISGRPNDGDGLTGPLPSFKSMKYLSEIDLQHNRLSGALPTALLQNFAEDFLLLDLSFNEFTGSVPASWSHFDVLVVYLEGNRISGIPSRFCTVKSWMADLVADYQCDAILCPAGTYNSAGRRVDSGGACEACPNGAPYMGSVECADPELAERDALGAVYGALGGTHWVNRADWLDEDSHVCDWYGVECDAESNVAKLKLSDNNLVGTFPQEAYRRLPHLHTLNVGWNGKLHISLEGIGNAKELRVLNLDGLEALESLNKLRSVPLLEQLSLSHTDFKGKALLSDIYTLDQLQFLLLIESNVGGTLSTEIGQMSSLQILNLFNNRMTGNIPSELGLLQNLKELSLAKNLLQGTIPNELGNAVNLEVLALSKQQGNSVGGLSGFLPDFMGLTKLTQFYAEGNALTGSIPVDFLGGLELDESTEVIVELSNNKLRGRISSGLSRFPNLFLGITSNRITSISSKICSMTTWMESAVQQFGCDAVLCPPSTFNSVGRQERDNAPCLPCPSGTESEYLGNVGSEKCVEMKVVDQKSILEGFYESTQGLGWKHQTHWLDGTENGEECDWFGITCDPTTGHVVAIELGNNNLKGAPTEDLLRLPYLQTLDLSLNPLKEFPFSDISKAKRLRELNLHSTGLSSLVGLDSAPSSLRVVRLGRNEFVDSSIPTEIYSLPFLSHLYFSESFLTGTISEDISNLKNLKGLYLYGNNLSGSVPSQIGNLSSLEYLTLASNRLTGTLPTTLNKLSSLKALSLLDQSSNGGGIQGQIPDFSKSSSLTDIFLASNKLTGTLPSSFLDAAPAGDSRTYRIDLSSNLLHGTVPPSLGRFDVVSLDITDNRIQSIGKDLCGKGKWMDGNVGAFGCDAILCPPSTANPTGRQRLEGEDCFVCPVSDGDDDAKIKYGSTSCDGQDRTGGVAVVVAEREILQKLYDGCGGDDWTVRTNWMDPTVDVCDWYGIGCENGRIAEIRLGGNNLVGVPPVELFSLEFLKKLALFSNGIDFRFEGIERAKSLTSLSLDSTGLTTLEGIGKAKPLKQLNLRFNEIKGSIPDEIFELENLASLILSDNRLTGLLTNPDSSWSSSWGNLKHLKSLVIGSNDLGGPLYDFAEMSNLIYLDVSNNKLTGTIAPSLLQLADPIAKVFIDLSYNRLEGTVPPQLSRFDRLSLHLKDNEISLIDPSLCNLAEWMHYDVRDYGCDGILCPVGTYNEIGRQSTEDTPCLTCETGGTGFMGSVECDGSDAAGVIRGYRFIWGMVSFVGGCLLML